MSYSKNMIRTQIYLPEDLYQHVNLYARKENKSAARIIRESIEVGLKKRSAPGIGGVLMRLSEIGGQGPADLSRNIDKYLYEE